MEGGGGVVCRGFNFDSIFFRYLKKCLIESELLSMKNFEVFSIFSLRRMRELMRVDKR